MYRRVLAEDAVLWWQGDAAQSVAVVEQGSAGVRTPQGLIDVLLPGMAIGEAALLDLEGPMPRRTADVVVLENDTVICEYPVATLADAPGVRQLILRTLLGQVCRNHLLVGAAHTGHPLALTSTLGLLRTLASCEQRIQEITDAEAFRVGFHLLYDLRAGSDMMRRDLVPEHAFDAASARAVLHRVGLESPDLVRYLDQFLRAESTRHSAQA